jgi:hypothetical protein
MNAKFLLPFAAVSVLALAACGGDTPPPAQPDPDAGDAVVLEETSETEAPEPVTEDLSQTVEEVQQEAAEAFERILETTQQAGEDAVEIGSDAMQSMSSQLEGAGVTLEEQIDNLITGLENLRDENLTDEQKLQAVASARTAAENAARLARRSDDEIREIGDNTEERAREALGL